MLFARLNAMIDGFGGKFVEAHPLDAKTAKRIPAQDDLARAHARRGERAARQALLNHKAARFHFG